MVEILRRYAAILVVLILAWLGYSDLNPDSGKKKAEAKTVRLDIAPEVLRIRGADETLKPVPDPYRLAEDAARAEAARALAEATRKNGGKPPAAAASGAPTVKGGTSSGTTVAGSSGGAPGAASDPGASAASHAPVVPTDPIDAAAAWLTTWRLLGRDVAGLAQRFVNPPPPAVLAGPPRPPAAFVLKLESTLALPDGGQARISGQTVQVGASLEGMDPEKPPRLLSVRGTEAVVAHGDDVYVLDLVSRPVVAVGEPALAVAQATPVQAGGAPAAARPRGTRGPTPAAPSAAKPAGAAKAGGGAKGTYKIRKLPTKKKP